MGILVVLGMLAVLSVLAGAGRVFDSRDGNDWYARSAPRRSGRDPAAG